MMGKKKYFEHPVSVRMAAPALIHVTGQGKDGLVWFGFQATLHQRLPISRIITMTDVLLLLLQVYEQSAPASFTTTSYATRAPCQLRRCRAPIYKHTRGSKLKARGRTGPRIWSCYRTVLLAPLLSFK